LRSQRYCSLSLPYWHRLCSFMTRLHFWRLFRQRHFFKVGPWKEWMDLVSSWDCWVRDFSKFFWEDYCLPLHNKARARRQTIPHGVSIVQSPPFRQNMVCDPHYIFYWALPSNLMYAYTTDLTALPSDLNARNFLSVPTIPIPVFVAVAISLSTIFSITSTLISFRRKLGGNFPNPLGKPMVQRLLAGVGFFGFLIGMVSFILS